MGFWGDLKNAVMAMGDNTRPPLTGSVTRTSPFANDLNAIIYRGGMMTRETASTVSAVHRAVTLIAGSGSDAIVDTLRAVDSKTGRSAKTRLTDYMVDKLKDSPDNYTPAHTFFEDALTDLAASGNAVFKISREAMNTARSKIELCHPLAATGYIDSNGVTSFRVTPDNDPHGVVEILPETQVIVCRWPRVGSRVVSAGSGRSRWFATPPFQSLGNAIMLSIDAEKWASKVFDRSSGAIGSDYAVMLDMIDSDTERRFMEMLELFAQGRSPLVLGREAKIQKLTPTPQDNDLLQLRQFQIDEVSRTFGVPGALLNKTSDGNTWGSALSALETTYLRYGLRLHLNRLLEPLSYRLLPTGYRFAIDESRVYRGDADALSKLITATSKKAGQDGTLSKAEIRRLIGVDGDYTDDYDDLTQSNGAGD